MSLMIESMESRVLLTASAGVIQGDLVTGAAALATAKANLKSAIVEAALDVKGFKADVKGVKLTATQKAALTTLEKTEAKDAAKTAASIGKILATGTARGAALESALKSLQAHPTKTAIQVKVAAAMVKLQNVFSTTVIGTVESAASADVTALDADLAAVATAIPVTQNTVNTTESDLSNDLTTLSNDVTGIENAITALATALA